jgi:hypothetical protein
MSDDAAGFVGNIPRYYDQGMGPMVFVDYAADIARRVAAGNPARVLETAGRHRHRHAKAARRFAG